MNVSSKGLAALQSQIDDWFCQLERGRRELEDYEAYINDQLMGNKGNLDSALYAAEMIDATGTRIHLMGKVFSMERALFACRLFRDYLDVPVKIPDFVAY